ncbi:amino acid transporter heavy chain SLC3A2 isoform X2 [Dromaius novaehollandiae]|uniref:amino acid transporter heavy chain SLC3A2 isoform X2 n=1 Tax=Dromaius novaehollandiae TaxID=8790 RepID=UPI00311D49F4
MEPEAAALRDVELTALDAEKQPMAGGDGGGEKNGLVKAAPAKRPGASAPEEDEEEEEEEGGEEGGGGGGAAKFTGLGKEELVQAAGAAGWARARGALLLLFWLGWLGMLGAAVAIVVRAPRCRPLPPDAWARRGLLYRAPPGPFAGDLRGVEERLEHVAGLKAQGLLLGPLHPANGTDLQRLAPALGSLDDFGRLLAAAKKKGLQVLLDLTPNPWGPQAWLEPAVAEDPGFQERVKSALNFWLQQGVDGFFLDGIEELDPAVVAEWKNITEQDRGDGVTRVLVGGTRLRDPPALRGLLDASPLRLVLGPFVEALGPDPPGPPLVPGLLQFLGLGPHLAWSLGTPGRRAASATPQRLPQLLLLLAALPGTPVLNYGDEVALGDPPGGPQPGQLSPMPWDLIDSIREGDNSTEARVLELCRRLGALRARERSLALGDAEAVPADPAAALLRAWDQSDRFLAVLNPEGRSLRLALRHPGLPPGATLRLSTHRPLPADPHVDLGDLQLLPYEGLLLSFPYAP